MSDEMIAQETHRLAVRWGEDAAQHAMLRWCQLRARGREHLVADRLTNWLSVIASNYAKTQRARAGRKTKHDVLDLAVSRRRDEILDATIARIELAKVPTVALLKGHLGIKGAAEVYGVPTGTIKSRNARALGRAA